VLDGEADLVFEDATAPGVTTPHRASAGMFAYYPAGFLHTIRNPSSAPVTYLMFKWLADSAPDGAFQPHCLMSVNGIAATPDAASAGIRHEALIDGETPYLRKLHAHVTVLSPGGGYAPHVDAHDVGIIVLRGTVETLGERVGQ